MWRERWVLETYRYACHTHTHTYIDTHTYTLLVPVVSHSLVLGGGSPLALPKTTHIIRALTLLNC